MTTLTPPLKRPGRPRSRRVDRALNIATRSLLTEVGYERLSMGAVAARAGVSKAALYRRWPSKSRLVAALVRDVWRDANPSPPSGNVRADLVDILGRLIDVFDKGRLGPAMATLIDASHRHELIAESMRTAFDERRTG